MAPKKKFKHGASSAATRSDCVPGFLQATKKIVNELYETRHDSADATTKTMPAPFLHGGPFKEIAQRAWQDPAKLISASKSMIEKAGICDPGLSMDEFGDLFLKIKAGSGPTDLCSRFWLRFYVLEIIVRSFCNCDD